MDLLLRKVRHFSLFLSLFDLIYSMYNQYMGVFPYILPSIHLISHFVMLKEIRTLTVDMRDDPTARPFPKAKVTPKTLYLMKRILCADTVVISLSFLTCYCSSSCFCGSIATDLVI